MNEIILFVTKTLIAAFFIILAPFRLYTLWNCKEAVIARLDEIVSHKSSEAFVFSYVLDGTEHQGTAMISLISLTFGKFRNYKVGGEYTIYVNRKQPRLVNVREHITICDVLLTAVMMLFGILIFLVLKIN